MDRQEYVSRVQGILAVSGETSEAERAIEKIDPLARIYFVRFDVVDEQNHLTNNCLLNHPSFGPMELKAVRSFVLT